MDMQHVDSSNIAAIGYDQNSETMQIEFISGGLYQYFDVPIAEFEALRDADSIGAHLARHIKGHYRYSRA